MAEPKTLPNLGGLGYAAFGPLYLATIPLCDFLSKPGGIAEQLTKLLLSTLDSSLSGKSGYTKAAIPLLSAAYIFIASAATGGFSVAAQAVSRREGLDNSTPRQHRIALRGLPLRVFSAHQSFVENFPFWALAAALAQIHAPQDTVLVNLLGLSFLVKTLVYFPAYILDIAPIRSLAHLVNIASVISVAWKVAKLV